MFYKPQDGHGLPHNPFSAIVAPRPIGWIATRGTSGNDNIAPYSFFNAVAYEPPQVMFSSTAKPDGSGQKDTLANIRETGVFAVNIVGFEDLTKMNASSTPLDHGVDEFDYAQIQKAQCTTIDCPYVATAPAVLECTLTQIIELKGNNGFATFGEVQGIRMRDDCVIDGRFDGTHFGQMARLGYQDYARVDHAFQIPRPTKPTTPKDDT